jgi:hypothetical protein
MIDFQHTPNPNAGKFTSSRRVVEGRDSKSFYGAAQAAGDPVASSLFELDGVVSIFMVEDFVTVTKRPDVPWEDLAPRVVATLERTLA